MVIRNIILTICLWALQDVDVDSMHVCEVKLNGRVLGPQGDYLFSQHLVVLCANVVECLQTTILVVFIRCPRIQGEKSRSAT